MTQKPSVDLKAHLRPDTQVRVAIHLPDNSIIDLYAMIVRIEDDLLHMETFRSSKTQLAIVPHGARVVVMSSETWAFCRGEGIFEAAIDLNFAVRIRGELEIQQRREFFRMDVYIPVVYAVPADQQMTTVEGMWKARRMMTESGPPPRTIPWQGSFKILNWNDHPNIDPCRVNLSGGGIRIKIPEQLTPGTLVDLDIFLPATTLRVISAVGSVIRSTEVLLNLEPNPSYVTAMEFIHLSTKDREIIISYLFNEQRNSLRIQNEI
ncbi:MAG: hypothetical protein GJT30_11765 [Geobacter sp.]|nr:hypothetical protein [Geobacter sp.]